MSKAPGLITKDQAIEIIQQSPHATPPSVNIALFIASTALHGQKQRDGSDYDSHYLRVGFNNKSLCQDQQIIAILHDVIEDSDWEIEDLKRTGFSDRVVAGVDAMTLHQGEHYFRFIERCSRNADALEIKLADLRDNMDHTRNDRFMTPSQLKKQQAYIVSYQYLSAVQNGSTAPATPILHFMKENENFRDHLDLYEYFAVKAAEKAEQKERLHQSALPLNPVNDNLGLASPSRPRDLLAQFTASKSCAPQESQPIAPKNHTHQGNIQSGEENAAIKTPHPTTNGISKPPGQDPLSQLG